MLNKKSIIFTTICFCFLYGTVFAQNQIISPYSRFGLGDLKNNTFARPMGMGGVRYALRANDLINYYNPASYSAFDTTTFVFETAVLSTFQQLKTSEVTKTNNFTNLNYLVFGMPITKWWGFSFGLIPFSSTGYNILYSTFEDIDGSGELSKVNYIYEGSGGINQFYLGSAFKIKNFSMGINATYLFGKIIKIRQYYFPDDSLNIYYYGTNISKSLQISDFYLNYGLQYLIQLNKEKSIGLGLVFSNTSKIRSMQNDLVRTFYGQPEQYNFLDTIENSNTEGNVEFPVKAGFGINYQVANKLLLAGDIGFQKWSDYRAFGIKDSLKNLIDASIGLQYIPQKFNSLSYLKRMTYRLGFRYSQSYLEIKNKQIDEIGFSFGLGFPLRKSKSTINLSIELGKKGTTANNLIQENFGRLTIGFSIFERWFIKNKLY